MLEITDEAPEKGFSRSDSSYDSSRCTSAR